MNEQDDPRRDEIPPPEPDTDRPRDEPPVWDTDDAHDEDADEAAHRGGRGGAPDEPPWRSQRKPRRSGMLLDARPVQRERG